MRLVILIAASWVATGHAYAGATLIRPAPDQPLVGTVTVEVGVDGAADRVDLWLDDRMVGSLRAAPWIHTFDAGFSDGERRLRILVWRDGMTRRETLEHKAAPLRMHGSIDVDLVEVPLTIRSRETPFPASLEIRESGRIQKILDLRKSREDSRFVVVMDRSLSMKDGRLEKAAAAVAWLRKSLRAGDSLEVIHFNHTVSSPRMVAAREPVRDELPPASGGTALFDALASIETGGRDVVIVLSDADDRHSTTSPEAVRRHLSGRGLVVYSATLSHGNAADLLASIAEATGGLAVRDGDPTRAMQTILHDIDGRMVAVYQSSSTTPGWRPIEVRSRDSGVRVLSARKGYRGR